MSLEAFVGPLPHPDHFDAYEKTLKGAADRILKLAERQSAHRMGHEEVEQRAGIAARSRGQWFAFILVVVTLALGSYLAATGVTLTGSLILLFGLAELGVATSLKLQRLLGPREGATRTPDVPAPPARRDTG